MIGTERICFAVELCGYFGTRLPGAPPVLATYMYPGRWKLARYLRSLRRPEPNWQECFHAPPLRRVLERFDSCCQTLHQKGGKQGYQARFAGGIPELGKFAAAFVLDRDRIKHEVAVTTVPENRVNNLMSSECERGIAMESPHSNHRRIAVCNCRRAASSFVTRTRRSPQHCALDEPRMSRRCASGAPRPVMRLF